MPRDEIVTTGFDEVNAILKSWTGQPLRKALRRAQRAALRPVLREAKRLAPVGETGDLRRGLKLRAAKRRRGRIVHRVTVSSKDVRNQSGVFYGGFVHWGTQRTNLTTGAENSEEERGNDFLKRAADNTQNEIEGIMVATLKRELEGGR